MGSGAGDTGNHPMEQIFSSLKDPALKSSVRVLILVSLGMNSRLRFSDLLMLTGTGKGSLHNHLAKLESSGYVTLTRYSFFSSPRVRVELTGKGHEVVARYLHAVRSARIHEP